VRKRGVTRIRMGENTNGHIKLTEIVCEGYTKESTYACCCLNYQLLRGDEICPKMPQNLVFEITKKEDLYIVFMWLCGPTRTMTSSFLRFLDHTQQRITVGRTPLDEWSARRIYLYLTTNNTHNRQTSIGLLWTSDQLVADTSTWQLITLTTDRHP